MFLRLRSSLFVFACSFVCLSGILGIAAPSVSAAGFCFGASGTNDQYIVYKARPQVSAEFDYVRGDATVADMAPCIGNMSNYYAAGSWVMFANIENDSSQIDQIGYGQACSFCPRAFVWTPAGYGAGEAWPGKLTPVNGHRIRAVIRPSLYANVLLARFTITDLTTGVSESYYGRSKWPSNFQRVWWGVETLDTSSELGPDAGSSYSVNLAFMGYGLENSSSTYFRTGLTSSDLHVNGSKTTNEHAHIGSWYYSNDMVNFESH